MNDILNLCSSALVASTTALKNTSSNLANMNTAGYRGTRMSFSSLFDSGTGSHARTANGGVMATVASLNTKPGGYSSTGNSNDLAVLGAGFFVLKDAKGELVYTRAGSFEWKDNKLVAGDGSAVQALENGVLKDITVGSLLTDPGVATTKVTFDKTGSNTLWTGQTSDKYSVGVTIFDSAGGKHPLTLTFTKVTAPTGQPTSNAWKVTVLENDKDIGSPNPPFELKFLSGGLLIDGASEMSFSYKPEGQDAMNVKVDFTGLKSLSSAISSSLSPSADGQATGNLQLDNLVFGKDGKLQLKYTNGESADGPMLALARTERPSDWIQTGSSRFEVAVGGSVRYGTAGEEFGEIAAGQLEGSNVDVSQEFSDLIVAQRMYQSASQVIQATSTLNDALLRAAGGR
ncbi:flagellar hook-basal body complex protein [Aquabacterium humicola]|uniref:flagellar hook-basal body complex protein n=1 Tax=Aquabacterium humicola TaxID=3237377 RepID=UPI002543B842|nr:flagellar hook-basal body complex protein [Rubrivivax pictus]